MIVEGQPDKEKYYITSNHYKATNKTKKDGPDSLCPWIHCKIGKKSRHTNVEAKDHKAYAERDA